MYKRCKELLEELEKEGKIKVWWDFKFPEKEELKLRLKDMLEEEVDEKYYLSDAQIDNIKFSNFTTNQRKIQEKQYSEVAPTLRSERMGLKVSESSILIKNNTKQGYLEAEEGDGVYTNPSNKRGMVQKGMAQTLTGFQDKGVVTNNLRIRKLTPLECWRLQRI